MTKIVFDIETGPEPDEQLAELFSFDESKSPGFKLLSQEFDPKNVKLGRMTDKEKIAAKIEADRQKFETEKSTTQIALEAGRETAWEEFKGKAALSPLTGQVLAVGMYCETWPEKMLIGHVGDTMTEAALIENTFGYLSDPATNGGKIIGHNIVAFDLPFLIRRGLKHGIKPPRAITEQLKAYSPPSLVDTMLFWKFGSRTEKNESIDTLAAFFGTTRKNGSGANFHRLFFGTPTERLEAIRYLENDIIMTVEVATKMGAM